MSSGEVLRRILLGGDTVDGRTLRGITVQGFSPRQPYLKELFFLNGVLHEHGGVSMKRIRVVFLLICLGILCGYVSAEGADARQFLDVGDAYYNDGKYEMAIKEYGKAIAVDEGLAAAYYHRGLAYDKMESIDKAIQDYSKAISLTPRHDDAQIYHNRGLAYLKSGNYSEAIEDYDNAIAINPKFTEAYHNRGIAYSRKGQYDKAIEDYNRALDIRPNYAGAYFSRGVAYVKKAEEDFRKVCAMGNKMACENLKQISE
jgi:tetratricopeptide (TPR) repeat protein